MTVQEITEFYAEWFSTCTNIHSKFRAIAIFEGFVNQNNGSNKTWRHVHDLLLYQPSFAHV
jgi:hypothetical protein